MKILVFENNYKAHNKIEGRALYSEESPVVYTLPDNALLKDHRPFFIPDFATECSMRLQLVVRICRLGRSISARFADRYYDSVSVGVTFTAENLLRDLQAKGLPWELATGFDGAAALGSFLPLSGLEEGVNTKFSLRQGDEVVQEGCGKDMIFHINQLIAYASQFYTLKQGDFLFTGCPVIPTLAQAETHLSGYVGEEKVLSFNVK